MPYKTILVHVDQSRQCERRIQAAALFALADGAHLTGAAMTGISRYVYANGDIDLARTLLAPHLDAMYEKANAALGRFDALAAASGVATHERRLVDDDPQGGLALAGRYADLIVVSQTDRDDPAALATSGMPEYVMLTSGRPVLVVPHAGFAGTIGQEVLLAWDGSIEATHALIATLPVLQRAVRVTVAVCNPDEADGRDPGADIALYLARQGVAADVITERGVADVADALLSLAAGRKCDLLVMGGYGHTRIRELLLGGVTASILARMSLPVLMAH